MADRIMVDTNVLLYAYDRGEPTKQPQALAVLDYLVINRLGVLDFSGATLSEVQFPCDV